MKVTCEIAEDLLPLYVDNVCSDQSKRAVEEHLQECEKCRKLIESTHAVAVPHIEPDQPTADQAVKKGFKKIQLRWWASILLVIIIIPLLFLGWNQYHNRGIHYTNVYEYTIGNAFMELLKEGNYEKAYEYIDIAELKQEWLEDWFEEDKLVNMEADGLAKFCEYGAKLEVAGGIDEYEYVGIGIGGGKEDGTAVYRMIYTIQHAGKTRIFEIHVSNDGVEYFSGGGSFLDDPLAQFSIWAEYLWQDYEGCYYDPETKQYIYYDTN